jgi:hypothetical protein
MERAGKVDRKRGRVISSLHFLVCLKNVYMATISLIGTVISTLFLTFLLHGVRWRFCKINSTLHATMVASPPAPLP